MEYNDYMDDIAEICNHCNLRHWDLLLCKVRYTGNYKTDYNTLHQHLKRDKEFIKTGVCEHCKQTKYTQWATKDGRYNEYDRSKWLELCVSCHRYYDIANHLMKRREKKPKAYKLDGRLSQESIDRVQTYAWFNGF